MGNTTFNPETAALLLLSATETGAALSALPEELRPQTLAQGYAVQKAFVRRIGEGIAGWKLAGGSPRGLRGELPNPPATGCLIPSRVFQSGAVVRFPPERSATLEVEVSLRFSRTVSPREEAFDAASMIEDAAVTVEVVCSRFVDRRSVGQSSFIADNVGFHALVRGDRVHVEASSAFEDDAGLWCDGNRIAASLSGDDRTNPFLSLGFLWTALGERGSSIPKGALVTTGTLTAPVDVTEPGYYEARLGNARVQLALTG